MSILAEINAMVKSALSFSADGSTFTLDKGDTLSHVARAWNAAHPDKQVTVDKLVSANGGLKPTRYRTGKAYNTSFPAAPAPEAVPASSAPAPRGVYLPGWNTQIIAGKNPVNHSLNNGGNVNYSKKHPWPGQIGRGGKRNNLAKYRSIDDGAAASIGVAMGIIRKRSEQGLPTTIPDIVRIYSPGEDGNDEVGHARNIAARSGSISTGDRLDYWDTGQMADLLNGIFLAESGYTVDPQSRTNAVFRGRKADYRRKKGIYGD